MERIVKKYLLIILLVGVWSCEDSASSRLESSFMRTALEYAYECESVLGPLPKFSCDDAIEVPSTKDGVHQTYPETEEGSGSSNINDCDHPWAFGMACQSNNKVGRYHGENPDGSENSDVVFITL